MADLHFVDFALIPSPASYLIHNLSEFDFTDSLRDEPFRVRFSRPFSSSHIAGRPLFGDPQNVLHDEGESKKFQHFRAQRWKSPLTSRCNVISGGIN